MPVCVKNCLLAVSTSAFAQWDRQFLHDLEASELVDDTTTVWKNSNRGTNRRRSIVSGFEKCVVEDSFFQGVGKRQACNTTTDNDNLDVFHSHAEAKAILR